MAKKKPLQTIVQKSFALGVKEGKKEKLKERKVPRFKKLPTRPQFDVTYTREQQMLRGMFGGGVGKNVLLMEHERRPQLNGLLRSGAGLSNIDDERETKNLMGFGGKGEGFFIKSRRRSN